MARPSEEVNSDDSPLDSLQSQISYQGDGAPTRRGWPHTMFISVISPEYNCNLCLLVLCKPMVSDCGCRFCYMCILQFLSDQGNPVRLKCPNPACPDDIEVQHLVVDSYAKKQLQKQRVRCENSNHGCEETFRLQDIGEHLPKCRFVRVDCENGCGAKLLSRDVASHLQFDCPLIKVVCEFCKLLFTKIDIAEHTAVCKKLLTPCPNNCNSVGIHPDMLNQHLERDCPEIVVNCIFQMLGCEYRGPQKDLGEHLRNNTEGHYSKLGGEVAKMKTSLSEIQLHMEEMRSAQNQANSNPTETTANIEKLSEMMKKLQLTMVQKFDKIGKLEKVTEQAAKKSDVQSQASRVDTLASQATSLDKRIQKLEEKAGQGPRGRKGGASQQSLEQRVSTLENQISLHAMRLAEHDVRFQVHGTTSYNGCLVWKIKDYARRKRDADSGKTLSLYSQPFFSSRYGFKMCARVYLNGDGIGKDTHMSLFFVIMKGDYDALLTWPFKQKVTLMLLDQESGRRHLSDSFRPDPTSSSFQKPTAEMNIASGCPLFVSQDVLRNSAYLKEDTIFLKIVVDVDDLMPL